jgi:glycosyltransferase involved in cell wall biosynthesis
MRIGFLHQYGLDSSGSGYYASRVCEQFLAAGHEVHLLCHERRRTTLPLDCGLTRWTGTDFEVLWEPEGSSLWVHRMPPDLTAVAYRRADAPGAPLFTDLDDEGLERYVEQHAAAATMLATRFGLDVLHANHEVPMSAIARRASQRSGVPYVVCGHGSTLEYVEQVDARYHTLAVEGLEGASSVIAITDELRGRMVAVQPAVAAKVQMVPVGVDVSRFHPVPLEGRTAHRLAFIGRLSLDKGAHLLLAALPLLFEQFPDLQVDIVGDGDDAEALQRFTNLLADGELAEALREIIKLAGGERASWTWPLMHFWTSIDRESYLSLADRLETNVTFHGRHSHEQLSTLLPQVDLVVVPSLVREGFPLVCLEALACGVPFVALNRGGLAAVVADIAGPLGDIGPMMGVDDADELVVGKLAANIGAAMQLLRQPGIHEDIQLRCRRLVLERYDWAKVAGSLVSIYETAAQHALQSA